MLRRAQTTARTITLLPFCARNPYTQGRKSSSCFASLHRRCSAHFPELLPAALALCLPRAGSGWMQRENLHRGLGLAFNSIRAGETRDIFPILLSPLAGSQNETRAWLAMSQPDSDPLAIVWFWYVKHTLTSAAGCFTLRGVSASSAGTQLRERQSCAPWQLT